MGLSRGERLSMYLGNSSKYLNDNFESERRRNIHVKNNCNCLVNHTREIKIKLKFLKQNSDNNVKKLKTKTV